MAMNKSARLQPPFVPGTQNHWGAVEGGQTNKNRSPAATLSEHASNILCPSRLCTVHFFSRLQPPSITGAGFQILNPPTTSPSFLLLLHPRTFVVHVGGHLHHAEAQVDGQVAEVVVGLQLELAAQLHVVASLVHLIDQHGVEVLVLLGEAQRQPTAFIGRMWLWQPAGEFCPATLDQGPKSRSGAVNGRQYVDAKT